MTFQYPAFDGSQACRKVDPATARAFAEAVDADLGQAKAVCSTCSFRRDCLDYALHTDVVGVWAGTSTAERADVRSRQDIDPPPSISDELDAWIYHLRHGSASSRPRDIAELFTPANELPSEPRQPRRNHSAVA